MRGPFAADPAPKGLLTSSPTIWGERTLAYVVPYSGYEITGLARLSQICAQRIGFLGKSTRHPPQVGHTSGTRSL